MRIIFSLFLILFSFASLAQLEKKALVIIDMQPEFVERLGKHNDPKNVEKVRRVIAAQHELINKAKESNTPIIVVTFKKHGKMEESLAKSLKKYPNKFELEKTTDSMFDDLKVQKELFAYLKKEGISDLVVTGANGGACVFKSIYSAMAYNYNVMAVSDAIADFNYKEFIYPYEYSKNKFYKPIGCKRCKFEEMMSEEVIQKIFIKDSSSVIQSERSSGKEIPEKDDTSRKNSTSVQ